MTPWKTLWWTHSKTSTFLTDWMAPTVSRMRGITSSWRYSLSACLFGFGLLFDKDLRGVFLPCLFVFLHAYYFFISFTISDIQFDCCGVNPVNKTNNDFSTTPWCTNNNCTAIPRTCCSGVDQSNYLTKAQPVCYKDVSKDYNSKVWLCGILNQS